MIRHIVFWTLQEEAEGRTKSENAVVMKQMLDSLKNSIPQIIELETGINFNTTDTAWDIALWSAFASNEDLDTYQKHPAHLKVVEFIRKIRNQRAVIDYVF